MNYSTVGRPRKLTAGQIAELLRWHKLPRTHRAMAKRLGVSVSTITAIIRTGGAHFKQLPPETR